LTVATSRLVVVIESGGVAVSYFSKWSNDVKPSFAGVPVWVV
jgi:hypothetical protein